MPACGCQAAAGLRRTEIAPDDPVNAPTSIRNADTCEIMLGQVQATITYAGLAPGTIGLYQLDSVVPNVPASDAVPVTFTLNGINGTQLLYIAVQ